MCVCVCHCTYVHAAHSAVRGGCVCCVVCVSDGVCMRQTVRVCEDMSGEVY